MKNKPTIYFLCEASPKIGFGHVGRCLALASAMTSLHCACKFIFRGSPQAEQAIRNAGFSVTVVADFAQWTGQPSSVIMLDLRTPLPPPFFHNAKKRNILLCTLDDPTPNRLHCHLAFYPPVPQLHDLDWSDFSGELIARWDSIPLREEFSTSSHQWCTTSTPNILITMGGSDPFALTPRVLRILKTITVPWHARIIIGPLFRQHEELILLATQLQDRLEMLSNVTNMAHAMCNSALAIATMGMTAYELAACGVPQILLSISDDHALSASALDAAGAAISLGRYDTVSDETLRDQIERLLISPEQRSTMHQQAQRLSLGAGAHTIGAIIVQRWELHSERTQTL